MIRWVLVFLWAGLIFYLSSIPNLSSGFESDFILRKFAHIFIYFILTILIFQAFVGEKRINTIKKINILKILFVSFCLSFLYALSDEYHQSFVFGRTGSLKDVFIDTLGILIAVFFVYFQFISRSKNNK